MITVTELILYLQDMYGSSEAGLIASSVLMNPDKITANTLLKIGAHSEVSYSCLSPSHISFPPPSQSVYLYVTPSHSLCPFLPLSVSLTSSPSSLFIQPSFRLPSSPLLSISLFLALPLSSKDEQ